MRGRWAVMASLALIASLAGCAAREAAAPPSPGALALVVGGHANMPGPVPSGEATAAIDMALDQHSYMSLIVADGAPYELQPPISSTPSASDSSGRSGESRQEWNRVLAAVAAARARTPQSDLLTALDRAARSIASRPGPRTIVVLDSGLSTAGPLNFTQAGMFDADPQQVADWLGNAQQLPRLDGISVIFQGLGDTAAPQEALPDSRRLQLNAIWTAVAKQAGAASVHTGSPQLRGVPAGGLPAVTPVSVPSGYRCEGNTVILTGGPLAYLPDSASFVDQLTAVKTLQPFATLILARQLSATLFGTYSDVGEPDGRRKLSNDRAQSVANVFIRLGVPVSRLRVEGLGSDFSGFVADRDGAGRLNPALAALNRTVRIELSAPADCG